MPIFDLGRSIKVDCTMNAAPEDAYRFSRQVLDGYRQQGYQVRFEKEKPGTELIGVFTRSDGTNVRADVKLRSAGSNRTILTIHLTGKVHVGGWKGAIASDKAVQEAARQKLIEEIKRVLKQQGLAAALAALHQRDRIYRLAMHEAEACTNRLA